MTNPMGYHITEEKTSLKARINLTLLKKKSGGFSPLPKPTNPKQKQSLAYEFAKGEPMSPEGSKNIAPGKSVKADGFEPIMPMPDMHSASSLLPSPMPFDQLKEKVVREITKVSHQIFWSPDSCASKSDISGRVSTVAIYLRPLSLDQLKTINNELQRQASSSRNAETVQQLWLDLLAMTGSNPAVSLIKHKIQNREVQNNYQLSRVLQSTLRSVRTPTKELLKEMLELVKEIRSQKNVHAFNVGIIQLANLVHEACIEPTDRVNRFPVRVYGRFCTEESEIVTRDIIPYLTKSINEVNRESERLVLMAALGKIGHKDIMMPMVKIIEGKLSKSPMVRSVAVYSLKRLAKIEPTLVKPVLLQIIDNPAENTEVRIAAVSVLPWTKPSTAELQKIAVRSWFEPSKQVVSFIYSTLESLTKTNVPELKSVGLSARNVARLVKPMQFGIQFSQNRHTQAFIDYLRIAHSVESSIVNTAKTITPARFTFSSKLFGGSWEINGLNFNLYTKGMDTFIDSALAKLGLIQNEQTSQEVRRQLEQITQNLNIHKREKDSPEALINFGILGFERIYAMDKIYFDNLIDRVAEKLTSSFSESGTQFNLTQSFYAIDIEGIGASDAGFPVILSRNLPVVLGLRGQVEVDSNGITAEVLPIMNAKVQANMGILTSFTRQFIGSGVEMSVHSNLPLMVKAARSSADQVELIVKTPDEIGRPIEPIHFFIRPFTTLKSLMNLEPISQDSKTKTILSGQPMKKVYFMILVFLIIIVIFLIPLQFRTTLGHSFGVDADLYAENDYKQLDFGYIWQKMQTHNLFSLISLTPMVPSVRYISLQINYRPLSSMTREFETVIDLGKNIDGTIQLMTFES